MTSLRAIRQSITPELEALNAEISRSLDSGNALMKEIVDNYLREKGKQIRPVLVILTAKLFGQVNPAVISAAAAVEMLHNASLIHDDVVDDSMQRRGIATINAVWNNHIAVLVGDFFVANALREAIATDDIRIITSIARLGKLLSLGEIDQIYNAQNKRYLESAYFEVIQRKTASLFESCMEVGAYAMGVNDTQTLLMLNRFARLLGECFQIKDDILDYYPEASIGKPTGNDLREGKVTLPLIYALGHAAERESSAMRLLLDTEQLDTAEIERLIEFAKSQGGIEYAYATMERLAGEAREALAPMALKGTDISPLLEVLDYVIAPLDAE